MLIKTIIFLNWFVLCYLVLFSIGYILLLVMSIRDIFLRYQEISTGDVLSLMKSQVMPPVTVIISAYNEENHILETVSSVLNSDYPNVYIIIVNDGSDDQTLQKLMNEYNLHKAAPIIPRIINSTTKVNNNYISESHKNIVVIDKAHSDKSDSLNIAVNACRTPLFITVDADSLVEPDTISEMIFYMMTCPHVVAVGGAVYVLNGCKYENGKITEVRMPQKFIPGMQACEYMRSFLFSRAGWNSFGGSLSYSGTATLFEHKSVVELGGFDIGNPANDLEIIANLHANKVTSEVPYQIGYTPAASIWTRVPATLKAYWKQRTNWQIGKLRSLFLHKRMLFNPKYKGVGFFGYPFFLFGETFGAAVELLAYLLVLVSWYLGILDGYTALLFFIVCFAFLMLLTMATVLLSIVTYNKYGRLRDVPWIVLLVLGETFGFRQYGVICRVVAMFRYLFGGLKRSVYKEKY